MNTMAVCVIAALVAAPAAAATRAIRAGKLIDPAGKEVAHPVVVVEKDRIVSIGTGATPAGAEVIDLSRFTIVPGLIDVHTHMTYYCNGAPGTRPRGDHRLPPVA